MYRFLALAVLAAGFCFLSPAPASAQFGVVSVNRVGTFPFRRTHVGFVGAPAVGFGVAQPALQPVVGFAPRVGFAPVGVSYGFAPVGIAPVGVNVGAFQGYSVQSYGTVGVPLGVGAYGVGGCAQPVAPAGPVINGAFGFGY